MSRASASYEAGLHVRLGVLVSGRGSNLEALLTAAPEGVEPVLVVSNRPGARALEVAAAHEVPSRVLRRVDFGGDHAARDAAIGAAFERAGVELGAAGGLRPAAATRCTSRPSRVARSTSIPACCPRTAARDARAWPCTVRCSPPVTLRPGVTIHEVTAELDAGPILAQTRVPVLAGDDPETLAARVLAEEHRLLVTTLMEIAATCRRPGPEGVGGHDAC